MNFSVRAVRSRPEPKPQAAGTPRGLPSAGNLIEGNDLTAVAQHVAEWADLLECEVYPVIEDAEAAAAAKKAFGK